MLPRIYCRTRSLVTHISRSTTDVPQPLRDHRSVAFFMDLGWSLTVQPPRVPPPFNIPCRVVPMLSVEVFNGWTVWTRFAVGA